MSLPNNSPKKPMKVPQMSMMNSLQLASKERYSTMMMTTVMIMRRIMKMKSLQIDSLLKQAHKAKKQLPFLLSLLNLKRMQAYHQRQSRQPPKQQPQHCLKMMKLVKMKYQITQPQLKAMLLQMTMKVQQLLTAI